MGAPADKIFNKGTVMIGKVKTLHGHTLNLHPGAQYTDNTLNPMPDFQPGYIIQPSGLITKEMIFKAAACIQLKTLWANQKETGFNDVNSFLTAKQLISTLNEHALEQIARFVFNAKNFNPTNVEDNFLLDFDKFINIFIELYNLKPNYYAPELEVMRSFTAAEKKEMQQILRNILQEAIEAPMATFIKYELSPFFLWPLPNNKNTTHAFLRFSKTQGSNWCGWMKQKAIDACCNRRRTLKID